MPQGDQESNLHPVEREFSAGARPEYLKSHLAILIVYQ